VKRLDNMLLIGVFVVGGLQLLGFLLQSKAIRGLGQVSAASPLPLVFTAHDGLETFAQHYAVELYYSTKDTPTRVDVDPRLYSKLSGSYNRRNVYGAIFAHGPILAKGKGRALIDSVARHGFCNQGPLLSTFGLAHHPIRVVLESKPNNPSQRVWRHEVQCK
jgi:hypothetical protein